MDFLGGLRRSLVSVRDFLRLDYLQSRQGPFSVGDGKRLLRVLQCIFRWVPGFRKSMKGGWMLVYAGWMLGDVGIVRW